MEFLYVLENIRTPFLDSFFSLFTELGGETVYIVVAVIAFWCISKSLGYYMLSVGFVGVIFNQFLKITCRVPRPWVVDENFTIVEAAREAATGYSFPSGHTQNAFAVFGTLALWFKNKILRLVAVVAIIIVAFSRMYLGVHTPLDVSISCVLGLILIFVFFPLFRDIEENPKRMYKILLGIIMLNIAYLAYVELWQFPADIDAENLAEALKNAYTLMGASIGMLVAYFIDQRYINFEVKACFKAQIVKLVIGLALVLAIKSGLKEPLIAIVSSENLATAIRYFLIIFFAAGIWPMTFSKIDGHFAKK